MANRAYLYVSDTEGRDDATYTEDVPECWYYDSRHNLPPAWLFFFDTADVRLIPREGWQEVRFVAPLVPAVDRFLRRGPLLRSLLRRDIDWKWVEAVVRDFSQMDGANLILDPREVIQSDDATEAARLRGVLSRLDALPPADPAVQAVWNENVYDPTASGERYRLQALGCTYTRDGRDFGFPDGYPTDDS